MDNDRFEYFAHVTSRYEKIRDCINNLNIFDKVENIAGRGENDSFKYFLFMHNYFKKASFLLPFTPLTS